MLAFLVLESPERLMQWREALLLNGLLIALAQRAPLLTKAGWVHAGILGTVLWGSLGWRGWLAVVFYLLLGSLVTRLGLRRKQELGLAEAPGTEGAISLEGSLASLVGSAVMALVALQLGLLAGTASWLLVTLVGLLATLIESLIGATLQGRIGWLSNELVNGLQTLIAALLAIGLAIPLGMA